MKRAHCSLLFLLASAAVAVAQTRTWTAATNPHVVNGTYTVPAGQTLVLEAGVIVQINANSTLKVNGSRAVVRARPCRRNDLAEPEPRLSETRAL